MFREEKHFVHGKRRRSSSFGLPSKRQALGPRRRRRSRKTAAALGVELKFYDTFLVGSALNVTSDATAGEQDPSATVVLNSVVQGDGESNRDGRKISMKNISVNGTCAILAQADATALDVPPTVFLALVMDTQSNGATIVSEQVYCNPGANGRLATHPYRNLQFSRRYKVLATKLLNFPTVDSSYDGTNIEISGKHIPFRMDVKLADIPVTYSGATESIVNITDNSIHVLGWANDISHTPQISYNARLRFVG